MAPMIFAKAILNGDKIKVFNHGKNLRDFTFIDDVVDSIAKCCDKPAEVNMNFDYSNPDPSSSFAPHRIFNVGNSDPIKMMDFIDILEKSFRKKAKLEFYPRQAGDVVKTAADTSLIEEWIRFKPNTTLEQGLNKFAEWFSTCDAIKYL